MTRSKQQSTKKASKKAGKKTKAQPPASGAQASIESSESADNYGAVGISNRHTGESGSIIGKERSETRTSSVSSRTAETSVKATTAGADGQCKQRTDSCGMVESASSSIAATAAAATTTEAMLVPKFINAQISDDELKEISRSKGGPVASFYEAQNDLISRFLGVNQNHTDMAFELQSEQRRLKQRQVDRAVHISVIVNIFVVIAQLYAAVSSRSLALFATMSEASMDLLSSVILLLASRAARSHDRFSLYPSGRFKLETIGVIIFAVLMGTFSVALLVESISALVVSDHTPNRLSTYDI
ncbi:hypothetical protein GGI23_006643, partial [Coemansia sp. RSA 2559]